MLNFNVKADGIGQIVQSDTMEQCTISSPKPMNLAGSTLPCRTGTIFIPRRATFPRFEIPKCSLRTVSEDLRIHFIITEIYLCVKGHLTVRQSVSQPC